ILAADTVPAGRKRMVIYAALDQMQDSTRDVMTMDEWRNMGELMGGLGVMGGPATGLLSPQPIDHQGMDAMPMKMHHPSADSTRSDPHGGHRAPSGEQ